jgi:hypothetical protein
MNKKEMASANVHSVQHRSNTIPMPDSHVPRTHSEVQLHEDTAAAEWRDLCMFYRVVNGIRERQSRDSSHYTLRGGEIRFKSLQNSMESTPEHTDSQPSCIAPEKPFQNFNIVPRRDGIQQFLSPTFDANDNQDGWSITGYEEVDPIYKIVPVVEVEDSDDDGVFDMEL